MPTYVYACSTCEKTFEVEQRITENPLTTCPCGSEGTVKRVIQPVGIAFKGSGFYVTDYAGGASAATNLKPEAAPSAAPAPTIEATAPASPASDSPAS